MNIRKTKRVLTRILGGGNFDGRALSSRTKQTLGYTASGKIDWSIMTDEELSNLSVLLEKNTDEAEILFMETCYDINKRHYYRTMSDMAGHTFFVI